jgi:NADH-quinone oxidoreductase subunit J
MEMVLFFVLALVAVAAAVGVIAQRNAARSVLWLLVNFCCLAGLYILLNAQFVAAVQIIVYAGAVVVLFVFVVMLLGAERAEETRDMRRYQQVAAVLLAVLLLAGIVWALVPQGAVSVSPLTRTDNVRDIGSALLTRFAIPFELVSVVLLVAIIGALVLAKKKLEG